jgi:hypothetical protein
MRPEATIVWAPDAAPAMNCYVSDEKKISERGTRGVAASYTSSLRPHTLGA